MTNAVVTRASCRACACLVALIGAVAGTSAAAEASEALVARAGECAAVGDEAARLACYDALFRRDGRPATPEGAAPGVPAAAGAATGAATAPPKPQERFGLENRPEPAVAETRQIESRVTAVRNLANGMQEVDLENGQAWRQLESDRFVEWQVGDTLVVRRAALGSFLASTADSRRALRVRRIR